MKTDEYNIRYYVKSLENPLFKDITAWHIFDFCLLMAFPKGSFTIGRNQLEKWSGVKGTTAYKALLRLKNAKMVTIEVTGGSTNRFSLISIVNWAKHQPQLTTPSNNLSNNQVTINEQSSNNPVTHYDIRNRKKEIGNKEEESSQIKEFQIQYPNLNILEEQQKCNDYILSSGKKYKDHKAMFRNWLRRAEEYRLTRNPEPEKPYHNAELAEKYKREVRESLAKTKGME